MSDHSRMNWALMREVPDSLNDCQHEFQIPNFINIEKARSQHAEYRKTLQSLGLEVDLLAADNACPDCCFVEDTAVLIESTAIICRTGAISRRAETVAVRKYLLDQGYRIVEMEASATLDGGDVLQIANHVYVGLSRRTNKAGFELVAEVARQQNRTALSIEVRGMLHLKTACTYAGQETVLCRSESLGEGRSALEQYRVFEVGDELDAANVSLINDQLLVPAHCLRMSAILKQAGFPVLSVDITEFHKAEAGLTCLAIFGLQ